MVEEGNDFVLTVIDKTTFFVAIWFMRKAVTREDFNQIEKDLNPPAPIEEPEKSVIPSDEKQDKHKDKSPEKKDKKETATA